MCAMRHAVMGPTRWSRLIQYTTGRPFGAATLLALQLSPRTRCSSTCAA